MVHGLYFGKVKSLFDRIMKWSHSSKCSKKMGTGNGNNLDTVTKHKMNISSAFLLSSKVTIGYKMLWQYISHDWFSVHGNNHYSEKECVIRSLFDHYEPYISIKLLCGPLLKCIDVYLNKTARVKSNRILLYFFILSTCLECVDTSMSK